MILTCPSCRTRYIVPDSAVGTGGRKVRCAQCRFSWFQEGPEPEPRAAAAPPLRKRPVPPPAAPAAPAPAYEEGPAEQAADWRGSDVEPEPEPPRRARRNPARMWTALAIVAALLMVGALSALYFIGPQRIAAWMSGGEAGIEEPLLFTRQSAARDPLPNDKELLTVTGEITNVSGEVQRVPQIRAEVTDAERRAIYETMVAPPLRELQPGQSVTFSFSSTDVPRGGNNVHLSFGPAT